MRNTLTTALLSYLSLVTASGTISGSISYEVSVDATSLVRKFELANLTNRVLLTGRAVDVDTGLASASVDAVAFGIETPIGTGGIGFYYGTLQADASYAVGSGSISASVSGSLSEVAVDFAGLAPYLNKDGVAGFQYNPGDDHFSCASDDEDCFVNFQTSFVAFADLGWNPIEVTTSDCAQAGGFSGCVVYRFSASSTGTTGVTASFDMYVAGQALELGGGGSLTPDNFKIDVVWHTPASFFPSTCNGECGVTLLALAGGKAVSASASSILEVTPNSATSFSSFTADAGKAAYFSWTSDVLVDGASSKLYASVITGANVSSLASACLDATFALTHATACIVNANWDFTYQAYALFGWELRLYFFSVAEGNPGTVSWDPQLGGADCEANPAGEYCSPTSASSSVSLMPLFLLASLL